MLRYGHGRIAAVIDREHAGRSLEEVLPQLERRAPIVSSLEEGLALVMVRLYPSDEGRAHTVRSFFGVHKIYDTEDGRFRVLMHGTTIHGALQSRNVGACARDR